MNVTEVEEILGMSRLPKPKHLIFAQEEVVQKLNHSIYYRGLQPKWRGDVMVLTPSAVDETIPHEALHCLGFGELVAGIGGKVLAWKARVLKSFPLVKSLVQKNVKYTKCSGCEEFKELHTKYANRVEHYKC